MAGIKSVCQRPLSSLDTMGEQLSFYLRALAATPRSVKRYPKEILRILAEVTLGSGALAVIGVAGIVFFGVAYAQRADNGWSVAALFVTGIALLAGSLPALLAR